MIDIKFLRENPGAIRQDLEKRNDLQKLSWVDEAIELDKEYRVCLQQSEELRRKRNEITDEINKLMAQKKDFKQKIAEAKKLPGQIKELESKCAPIKEKIDYYLMRLPNILHPSVPVGKDDSQNVLVREVGKKISRPSLEPHGDILEKNGWADFTRASKVAGSGFYFFKGQFALLELSLMRYVLDKLIQKGYSPIAPPFLMNRAAYEGVVDLGDFENVMYKIEGQDLYLIATSEHPLEAMFRDEIFSDSSLPLKFAGISACFRKEIGKHGIDTRGLFRVHHFNKVEQFIFCRPEDSWNLHEELLSNAETIFQKLKIPYRVMNICTGDIGTVAAKKYDIEAWSPRENLYREVVSCSNCTSYQAVRLNIKYRKGEEKEFLHTLNSTAVATSRALRAIIENFQQKDGTIKVPAVLQKYLGKKVIGKKEEK